ncbi:BppU family phage baseplate upper protein [Paraclostridium bifermentans]|uniref:BppU family phage baseplate upper protein n=1 Tax=Paraclostridium bifermentans TaxID=1490 RepID=UPI00242F849C|nr:BppU family phage baseplate upper protein [Paraclostridium bifermentans]
MNLGTYDINIDFSKLFIHNNTSIYFKEGDLNTAKVRARLTMKNKPINIAGCNVTIRIEPSSGNTITDNATVIDPLNGIIEIDLKSNALLEGTHLFEVWIIKDESVKKSGKIGYRVLDSIDDAGAIEGTNEYPILISLISDTNKAIQDAKEVLNIAKDMEGNVNEAIGNTNIAISNAETATSNANSKITELDDAKTSMITKVDASIDTMKSDVNKAKEDMKLTTDAKIKEIDTAITNMNLSVEDAKSDMQATTDAKMQQVDNSIFTMKSEVETAKNKMVSKADEKIADVDRALAAGTVDLELKASRDGEESLPARLKRDLYIDEVPVKQRVLNLENMKEMQDLEYSTDKGYTVCEKTGNGTVKDLKIYGRSLVNVFDKEQLYQKYKYEFLPDGFVKYVKDFGYGDYIHESISQYKVDTEYTVIIEARNNTTSGNISFNVTDKRCVFAGSSVLPGGSNLLFASGENGVKVIKVRTSKTFTESTIFGFMINGSNLTGKVELRTMVIEGDHTQNPPSYFKVIASVGNGNEIEVLSVSKGNISDGEFVKGVISSADGALILNEGNYNVVTKQIIPVQPKMTLKYKSLGRRGFRTGGNTTVGYYDINNKFLSRENRNTFEEIKIPSNCYGVRFVFADEELNTSYKGEYYKLFATQLSNMDTTEFAKVYKKTPLFKDVDGAWKTVTDLNEWDVLDTVSHKLEIGTEKISFSDNRNWRDNQSPSTTHKTYWKKYEGYKLNNVICDKLPVYNVATFDKKCIFVINNEYLYFTIPISECSDISKLGEWFVANPMDILIPTPNKKVFEINPIYPEAFEDETLMLFKTGPISPRATWKITSNLVGVLGNVKDRVKRMENDFYKYTVTQNRMQLGTTYSSDRTTFRVDTATFTTEKAKQELDYDLFRLLRHNILVGPHNYDKAEMENMMDFYVSVGKIDYNMWDELYMLIEEQHNPPVEEEAPVI